MHTLVLTSWIALSILLLTPRPAHAYLDPSTGSMLLSALISIGVTTLLGLQAYGYRLLGLLRRLTGRGQPADSTSREPVEPAP